MSARPGVVASVKNATPNGGVSPNAFVSLVTAEIRVYWPPRATDEEIDTALAEAVILALDKIKVKRARKDWLEWESGRRFTAAEVAERNARDYTWRGLTYDPDQLQKGAEEVTDGDVPL